MNIKMLSHIACEELAEIMLNFVEQAPERVVPRIIKARIGASHSLLTAGIIEAEKKDKYYIMMTRMHYWLHQHNIPVAEFNENDKNTSKPVSDNNGN